MKFFFDLRFFTFVKRRFFQRGVFDWNKKIEMKIEVFWYTNGVFFSESP